MTIAEKYYAYLLKSYGVEINENNHRTYRKFHSFALMIEQYVKFVNATPKFSADVNLHEIADEYQLAFHWRRMLHVLTIYMKTSGAY